MPRTILKIQAVDSVVDKQYLVDIRDALIYSLSTTLGLKGADIAKLFGVHRSVVSRAIQRELENPTVEAIVKPMKTINKKIRK